MFCEVCGPDGDVIPVGNPTLEERGLQVSHSYHCESCGGEGRMVVSPDGPVEYTGVLSTGQG